ncbi:MAG: imidazoleglycerol-phosphate dehydratase HisB [Proteobacteria bacterium]|nr:imidazoleglycerol-phosphate dehydratase HisB [Pseudomonadota bacterium]MBU1584958.1 imidazoleglycerol-phosphate dehydratase HisB [Pseudomonadota bacterium]MBU2455246.1 imidazoleglycerol-phosphate dehydratase HisB [Pseudomonadota bacterium]MBU2628939.1 imidazoleglycerol-phosphate dehydratase HisB [Pseudomonadota bacterium]
MNRKASISRKTKETEISIHFDLDGSGKGDISTGIPFFDHMLTAFTVHGFFDLQINAKGDLDVDYHHTIEDIGLVFGQVLSKILETKKRIVRFGDSCVPMDESLSRVTIDLSNRPYLVYNFPENIKVKGQFDTYLVKEFFQAFCVNGAFNLHINSYYGVNEHHVLESIFKAFGRALYMATRVDEKISGVLSSKGSL